jgi:hypothetical protein
MHSGVNNGFSTFQKAMKKIFKEYLDIFMTMMLQSERELVSRNKYIWNILMIGRKCY